MTIIVKLNTPIAYGNQTYSEVTLRKPKAKDLIAAEKVAKPDEQTARTLAMLASIAGIPLPAMQELEMEDVTRLATEFAALVGESPVATGGSTPSS